MNDELIRLNGIISGLRCEHRKILTILLFSSSVLRTLSEEINDLRLLKLGNWINEAVDEVSLEDKDIPRFPEL